MLVKALYSVAVVAALVAFDTQLAWARAFFDSVETEKRGKALFEKARPLREALDRNEKRSIPPPCSRTGSPGAATRSL